MSRRAGGLLWTLSVVGVAAWGCGGGGPKTIPTAGGDTFVEGTRLKARWFQLPGARRMFAGWFDSQLGENCQFEDVASFGLATPAATPLYCRPSLGSATGEVFADAACSQMLADVPCADYHFVQLPPLNSGDCTSPNRVFRVGDAVTTGMSYARVEGVCTPLAATDPRAPRSPRRLGAEVTLDAFVSATTQVGSGSGRIVPTMLVASDGSQRVVGAWDSQRQENVFAPNWFRDAFDHGIGKWEPAQIAERDPSVGLFSDATCTALAATYSACGDVPVRSVFERQSACWPTATYYEAGPKLTPGTTFIDDGVSCRAGADGDAVGTGQVVATGAPISPSRFADVKAWEEQSATAVGIRRAGTADGPVGPDEYMMDHDHGNPCWPWLAADGVLRCLPNVEVGVGFYADPDCSVPLLVLSPADTACESYMPPVLGVEEQTSSDACGHQYKLHEFPVGGSHVGAAYSGNAGGNCTAVAPAALAAFNVFDLGPEIPASSFAALATSTPF